ncbi:hypothetical protein BATDEDRAFT_15519 [Batrachochytrium dendrobatidis JAM81]|uniref:Alkaline phosphatase n=1 Tax=Batrachochytrium dendrobatidis (strain JAM81 / FGSC 10211) TaxID=684364 RepID=F4NRH6_BATDJ|nr:uncharacterized protein BATDEDRAFT_15519 [Batrachochytrium dendrobatidis JAM81]EGF84160.1 hypothetical protein BATDEDRAFT_15519 [Batrachochytrium dendrobatidis JAM81]|eukprot:XP_006675125.1 hypothetical protein BATDEDRAFT_15519 [Batrachochytrium dendrobatidis JAM81]
MNTKTINSPAADLSPNDLEGAPFLPPALPYEAAKNPSDQLATVSVLGIRLQYRKRNKGYIFLLCMSACLVTVAVITAAGWYLGSLHTRLRRMHKVPVRNVIMMISDGFGPASQTLARNYNQYLNNLPVGTQLPLDTILVGSSRTRSSSSFVTDSAAGATAFSCALKTYNGAIGVNSNGIPCGTVLEAAKDRGMFTGLVATSRITHATPAAFSAHVGSRNDEDQIALQQLGDYKLGRRVDLMFGGGLCHFLPNSTAESCRTDGIDVMEQARNLGWNVGVGKNYFDQIFFEKSTLPLLNLFTLDHMSYDIDRDDAVEPSLTSMSLKALDLLNKASLEKNTGFFLMIEGSRIDMAAHTNDPSAHIGEILQYNTAISAVKKFVDDHPDTILISTSDHETGGLSVGYQLGPMYPIYAWFPEAITGVKRSAEYIVRQIKQYSGADATNFIKNTVFPKWLNNTDPDPSDVNYLSNTSQPSDQMEYKVGGIVSSWAGLGWSTHGHSAVDVNLYAYGANSKDLFGNHENTDIGNFIIKNLNLDLAKVTQDLNGWKPGNYTKIEEHSIETERHIHAQHNL